jgi:signal transduction histidine kinase
MYKCLKIFVFLWLNSFNLIAQNRQFEFRKLESFDQSQLERFLIKSIDDKDSLAIAYAYKALASIKTNNPSLRFEVVELSLKSIEFFQNHDETQKNWQKMFLANLFNENYDSKLSLEYASVLADSVFEFSKKTNDAKLKMTALQVMYRIGSEVKNKKISKEKALIICDSLVQKNLISDFGSLKMHYYSRAIFELNRDLTKADSLFLLCKKYAQLQKDTLIISHCYIHTSYIRRMQEEYQAAISTITDNISEKTLLNYPDLAKWIYQEIAQDYAALGNDRLSNKYWDLYFRKSNEIAERNFKNDKLSELIDSYLSKKQLLENEKLQEANLTNISIVKRYKNLLIFIPILFAFAFAVFLFRSKWNKLLNENLKTSILMEGQELERNRLSKELHDGVGSSLAALKTNLYFKEKSPENNQLLMLIDDLYLKVRDISHQVYPSFLITDGLVIALNDYIKMINKDGKVVFTSFGKEPEFDSNKLLNIFRIIQELLNNALKHANASKIEIELLFKKEEIFIRVQDNGKGFDAHHKSDGIGLKNINSRIDSIKGHMERISEINSGTTFLITIQNS